MKKRKVLSKQEQDVVINSLRKYLDENKIDQRDFAKRINKDESTLSRWMTGKYTLNAGNASLIEMKMRYGETCDVNAEPKKEPSNLIFYQVKTQITNFIMLHPNISEKSKVEVYNALQDFQLASPTPTHTPTGE